MAKSKKGANSESSRPQKEDLLESFLLSFENFVGQISAEAARAAGKGEHLVLIQSTGESLREQTSKLTAFVREEADRVSGAQRAELDKFLRVQNGVALANRGIAGTKQLLAKGTLGRLIEWIASHLKELKKILKEILALLFGNQLADWVDVILLIIDEIAGVLLSLLSDVFGIDFGRAARQLSDLEVNYLRELAALESLRAARLGRKALAQDET